MSPKANFLEIKESLHPYIERVERLIDTCLASDIPLLDTVNRSLRERTGKMLRPMIALLAAGAAGGVSEDSIRFAAAAELLHNATLLHDDVVDGASERRGTPTVSSILGGSAAVLVGDFWLVKCMQVILASEEYGDRVLRIFSKTISDLAEGEMLQLQKASEGDTTQEDYLRIIYNKTASLFEAAALSAAVSADAPGPTVTILGEFAKNLGLAFQIKDDIMDYSIPADGFGKPVGQDLMEQKITQPLLCALESVSGEEAMAVRKKVVSISDNPALAEEVRAFVLAHDGVAKAEAVLDYYIEKAIKTLQPLPTSAEKSYLAKLSLFVGARDV